MNIIKILPLFLLVFALSCTENQPISQDKPNTSQVSTDLLLSINGDCQCANQCFPSSDAIATSKRSFLCIIDCEVGTTTDSSINALRAAFIWSQYSTSPNQDGILPDIYCSTQVPIMAVHNLKQVPNGNIPKIEWDFVYSHYYVVKRIIAGTSTLTVISNKTDQSAPPVQTTFIDNSIDLNTITSNITYEVYYRNFDNLSYARSVTYYAPLSANILGPSIVLIPGKYSPPKNIIWSASVSGGHPTFTYEWYYNDILVGTFSSYTKTYKYIGYDNDRYSTVRLVVHDQINSSVTKTKNVFEDSDPYNN